MSEMQICCHKKYDYWGNIRCNNTAKVERAGEWYCGIHDPEKRKAKLNAIEKRWLQEALARDWNAKKQARRLDIADAVLNAGDVDAAVAAYRAHLATKPGEV